MSRLSLIVAAGALAALLADPAALRAQRPTTLAGRSTVYAPHGVVATSQPLATAAGLDGAAARRQRHRRRGHRGRGAERGRAAHDRHRRRHVRDRLAREGAEAGRAQRERPRRLAHDARDAAWPAASSPDPQQGVMSVTVPGALAGWDMLLRKHGTAHARPGAAARDRATRATASRSRRSSPRSGRTQTTFLERDSGGRRDVSARTDARRRRASGSGTPTTRARCGRSPTAASARFYGGALGQRIVARLAALGGFLTLEDLERRTRRPG